MTFFQTQLNLSLACIVLSGTTFISQDFCLWAREDNTCHLRNFLDGIRATLEGQIWEWPRTRRGHNSGIRICTLIHLAGAAWTLSLWPTASIHPQVLCFSLESQGSRRGVCSVLAGCMGLGADNLACVVDGTASPQIHNTHGRKEAPNQPWFMKGLWLAQAFLQCTVYLFTLGGDLEGGGGQEIEREIVRTLVSLLTVNHYDIISIIYSFHDKLLH